jgi:isopenicillin N synthase-like dioxygenase
MILDFAMATDARSDVRLEFGTRLRDGLEHVGFVRLTEHGIAADLTTDVYAIAEDLFRLTFDVRHRYYDRRLVSQRMIGGRVHEQGAPCESGDTKEMWSVGRRIGPHPFCTPYPPYPWASELANHERCFGRVMELYDRMDAVFRILCVCLAGACDIGVDRLLGSRGPDRSDSLMRLLRYPPGVGANEHRDSGLLTLLLGATSSGLEISDRHGQWEQVAIDDGHLLVTAGLLVETLLNAVLKRRTVEAKEHRVKRNEARDAGWPRMSLPFFGWPDPYHPVGDGRLTWEFLRDDLRTRRRGAGGADHAAVGE